DAQFVFARRVDHAAELHVAIVAGAKRADAPGDFAGFRVFAIAFAGADELGAGGHGDADDDVLGRGRAWIANAEEIRGRSAGVVRFRTAPIDFQFRLAAEELFDGFGREAAIGRCDCLNIELARFTRRELDFDGFRFARLEVAEAMCANRFAPAAGR